MTRLDRLLARKRGVLLDISVGGTPQPGSVTIHEAWGAYATCHVSARKIPPALRLPFPLPTACVHTAVVTHVLEFLAPQDFFPWMDELHRVMRLHGIVHLSGPYGGDESIGWISDPTHKTRIVEESFAWLDPRTPIYHLHETVGRPTPRPWHVLGSARVPGTLGTISYNVTMQALPCPHPKKR